MGDEATKSQPKKLIQYAPTKFSFLSKRDTEDFKMTDAKRTKYDMDTLCVNNIRALSADVVQGAKSGHPGAPMGCAPVRSFIFTFFRERTMRTNTKIHTQMAHVLFGEVMKFDSSDAKWINRDRFVLSNGHASLSFSTRCFTCAGTTRFAKEDLKDFRQLDSKTPGHPESHMTSGVEVSTGPLGQGISNAVGLAIARTHMASKYNRKDFPLFDHNVYVICGDGCLQEGVSSEACSLAGHLKLGSLIVLYDDNKIQIDGSTDLAFTEDVLKRYEAYGWHTQTVIDGDQDVNSIRDAIRKAKAVTDRPSLIKIRTTIGFGSAKQGTHGVHGAPLGPEDISNLKRKFGMNPDESYSVNAEVMKYYRRAASAGATQHDSWNAMFEKYAETYPKEATELRRRLAGHFPETIKVPELRARAQGCH